MNELIGIPETWIATTTVLVQTIIYLVRLGAEGAPPRWVYPTVAIVGASLVILGLFIISETAAVPKVFAQALIGGLIAGGAAIGVHELGKKAERQKQARREVRK